MLQEYLPLHALGSGATGIVFLAKGIKKAPQQDATEDDAGRLYAMKAFRRLRDDDLQRCHSEERILSRLHSSPHRFLPRLHSAFDHAEFRFLVLDFCAGGDLNSLQHSLPDKRFSPSAIRFYAAEIVLALEHLHAEGIVYRDLKAENILLSADGHIMLSDFDLSIVLPPKVALVNLGLPQAACRRVDKEEDEEKYSFTCLGRFGSVRADEGILQKSASSHAVSHTQTRGRVVPTIASTADANSCKSRISSTTTMLPISTSFVGTEAYVAPEMIKGSGHDFAVDWWALGVLLFEMAHASTPFTGSSSKESFHNILHSEPTFPGITSESLLSDFIRKLLVKDPSHRLGAQGGASEVKAHPFFGGLRWDALQDVHRPPFIPSAEQSKLDETANFDLLSHLAEVDGSRAEARAERRLQRKKGAPCSAAT